MQRSGEPAPKIWLLRGKLFSQQRYDGRFYRFSAPRRTVADRLSIDVCLEYGGVNIRLTTHSRGVPQALRYRLDDLHDVFSCISPGIERREAGQRPRRRNGARPGAKVFGGEIAAARFA